MMVVLTAVIAASGIVGTVLIVRGGADTNRMIAASEAQAYAARSFATSTVNINRGIGDAVTKLGRQTDNAEAFFEMDERAWVEIGSIDKTIYSPSLPLPTTFKFAIYPKNIGKTLARDLRISLINSNAGVDLMSSKHGIKMSQNQLFRESGNPKKRSIIPDVPGPQTLAPGEQSVVPVYAGGSEPQYGRYSYILGKLSYIDAFGVQHWKHFCFFVANAKGEMGDCQYGNDEDNNSEPKPRPN